MENVDLEELYKKLEAEEIDIGYDNDILRWYLNSIQMPLLTGEESKILLHQISLGDKRARNIFIKRNLRLPKTVAFKYIYCGLSIMDLIEEGNFALIKAVDNYDLSYNRSFSTFAYIYIDGIIKRAICKNSKLIRLPININSVLCKMNKYFEDFLFKNDREPTDEELAAYLNISIKQLCEIKDFNNKAYLINDLFNREVNDGAENELNDINDSQTFEGDLIDRLTAPVILDEIINNTNLTEKELLVIKLKYGLTNLGECKQKDITAIVNLSKQRVSQIKQRGLRKLNKTAIRLSYIDESKKV